MTDRKEYEENRKELLDRGMELSEIENFLTPDNRVMSVELHIPGAKVSAVIAELSKVAIIPETVKVRFCFAHNRYQEFTDRAEKIADQPVIHGNLKAGELLN